MENKDIKMNMLRDRATPLPDVTEDMFKSCNPHNVMLIEQYLQISNTLSKETLKQYKSGLYQFTYYLKQNLMDKPFYKVSKLDFKRYMSYLVSRGLSSSALKFKKSAVSAFCGKFIETFIVEDDENYSRFRNFTTGTIDIPKNKVYEKVPITKEEYDLIMDTLKSDENYMGMAWVATMWNVGCRKAECVQFKKEIIDYDANGKTYVLSHTVRGKGKGFDGKPLKYMMPLEVIEIIKIWLDKRGYDHEYIFTTKYNGEIKPISKGWGDDFCTNVLSDIIGRRVNCHIFKGSCASYLLSQGKDLKAVSKYVCQHEDISTTQKFYDLRSDDEERDSIFS